MSVIDQIPTLGGNLSHDESSGHAVDSILEDNIARAAIVALTAFFRYCFHLHYLISFLSCLNLLSYHFCPIYQGWW